MALPVSISDLPATVRVLAERLRRDARALDALPGLLSSLPPEIVARTRASLVELTATVERRDPLRAADVLLARFLPRVEGDLPYPLPDGVGRTGPDGQRRQWVSGWDPEGEVAALRAGWPASGPVLLCGLARTPLLRALDPDRHEILVWEPDAPGQEAAWAWGHATVLARDPARVAPAGRAVHVVIHPGLQGSERDAAREVAARVQLAPVPPRLPRSELDVWIVDRGRGFHGERELAAGLRALGHGVTAVDASGLTRRLRDGERPDLVVSVNLAALVLDEEALAITRAADVGVVAWFVDEPLAALRAPERFAGMRLLALAWEREAVPRLRTWGLAADNLPLGALAPPAPRPSSHPMTVAWVGSSYAGDDRRRLAGGAATSPEAIQLRDLATEALARDRRLAPDAVWTALSRLEGAEAVLRRREDRIFLQTASADDAAARRRGDLARALAPLGLDIFGDVEGWSRLATGARLHPGCRGDDRFGIYARSQVNVDLAHPQMPTAVTLRAFEVPLAGGLLLADDRPALHEHYDVGREVLAYADPVEAREQAAWALRNPRWAVAIARAGRERARAEHTVVQRARRLLQLAREHRVL